MRSGGEYFTQPAEPAQRRYEALRAYFVEELSAAEVGTRFGYSPAVVHQMASELRAGKAQFFASSKPGPQRAAQDGADPRPGARAARAGSLGHRDRRRR